MIAIPPQAKIYVAIQPIDFRNGINGLGRICREKLKQNPMGGGIFVFRNRRKNTLKILVYDGEAFWMLVRRLSKGSIKWWPNAISSSCPLRAKELQTLIMNGNPESAEFSDDWKKIVA